MSHVPVLDERRQRMAAYFKCPPADVACEGCQKVTPQLNVAAALKAAYEAIAS